MNPILDKPIGGFVCEGVQSQATRFTDDLSSEPGIYAACAGQIPADVQLAPYGYVTLSQIANTGTSIHSFTNVRSDAGTDVQANAEKTTNNTSATLTRCKFRFRFFTSTCYFKIWFNLVTHNYISGGEVAEDDPIPFEWDWEVEGIGDPLRSVDGLCLAAFLKHHGSSLNFAMRPEDWRTSFGGFSGRRAYRIGASADKYAYADSNNLQPPDGVYRDSDDSDGQPWGDLSILVDPANRGNPDDSGWLFYPDFIANFPVTELYEVEPVEPPDPVTPQTGTSTVTLIEDVRWSFVKGYEPDIDGFMGFPKPV